MGDLLKDGHSFELKMDSIASVGHKMIGKYLAVLGQVALPSLTLMAVLGQVALLCSRTIYSQYTELNTLCSSHSALSYKLGRLIGYCAAAECGDWSGHGCSAASGN